MTTKQLNQARDRNPGKFQAGVDWFELTPDEVTNCDRFMNNQYLPCAYSKRGAYMFATILKTEEAIEQAINVVDGFNNYVHLVEQVKSGKVRFTQESQPNAVIDALTSELLQGKPRWKAIVRYKKLNLTNVEIGRLIGFSKDTVRKNLRRMEACGLIKPPANLIRMQMGAASLVLGNN